MRKGYGWANGGRVQTAEFRGAGALARFCLPAPQLKAHHGQHQIGLIRRFAKTAIGAGERREVKVGHGSANLPGEMIAGQLLVKFAPAFRIFRPGRFGKTSGRLGMGCQVA